METKETYFQFPLFLLRDLIEDKEKTLNNILRYGAYSFSQKLFSNLEATAKQLMYEYYRGDLPNDLFKNVNMYIIEDKIQIDEDYNGFHGSEFNPEVEIEQLLNIWETDNKFKNRALELHKMKLAFNFIGITGNFDNAYNVGEQISNSISPGEPMPMINKELLFQFRDNEKTEFELIQLACYIGIRSILGVKSYWPTNKKMILCRAFGYSSIKVLPKEMRLYLDYSFLDSNRKSLIDTLKLSPETMQLPFYKYSNRYQVDKVLKCLELNNWNLHFYSNQMRGLYVGIKKKISLETLVLIAETNKQKNKVEKLKQDKNNARQKALQQLNKEPQLNKG
jgi:hypothetical protein